ncbi:pleckstrin homology domain-containing family G member 1-like [Watersipora subatra]|uniref:pleckstrin homology domain-containing family G member 1-like n=1 Tax=Watersipora subatra TaxID=2589382 RepID=UPI00355C6903
MEATKNQRQILTELITTEENYVSDIQDVLRMYLPCFTFLDGITHDDVTTVFSNIASIYSLNKALLVDLVAAHYSLADIANSFLMRSDEFEQYSSYCTRYHRANERLFELKQKNPVLTTILQDLQRSLGHPLPLSSYLHKPVQRILKYHLILKNLLESVEETEDAWPLLVNACECMASCAEEINNCKRLTEMDVKTRELHELLLAIRETDHFGKLLRESEMEVMGCSTPSKTMFIYLFENVLVLCHRINEVFALHTILRCLDLVVIEDYSKREVEFMVVPFSSPSQAVTLRAKTLPQKLDWCIQLDKLTNHNIPSKAKKLLLANHGHLEKASSSQTSGERQMKRRPSLPHLLSPSSIGKKVRRRLTTSVLTKSKSSINLRRSSSTTSGGSSSLIKNYDSAFESMSLKSDISCSSDQLSSISFQLNNSSSSQSPFTQEHSYDDLSPHASKLHSDMGKGEFNSWHHKLISRIHQFQSSGEMVSNYVRVRSKSCNDLLASSVRESTQKAPRTSTSSKNPAVQSTANSDFKKSLILKKMIRWKHGAKKRCDKVSLLEETTPTQSQELLTTNLETPSGSDSLNRSSYSSPSMLEFLDDEVDNNDNEVCGVFEQSCAFDLDILHNFSDSLIERFNTVLKTANAT